MATVAAPRHAPDASTARAVDDRAAVPQYSRRKIAGVWAAAALPMGMLSWVIAPWLADHLDGPNQLIKALLLCLTGGLVWQFALVVGLVAHEQRTLRWSRVRRALWLQAPRSPRTGQRGGRIWLLVIPLIAATAVEGLVLAFEPAAGRDLFAFLDSQAGHAFLDGAWGWFAVMATMVVFNTVLGEELLFRGLLLPRMNGAFGRGDWIANGVLFAAYHLHTPWVIPTSLLDTLIFSYPSRRFRSALMGIVVHSGQSVLVLALTLSLVIG